MSQNIVVDHLGRTVEYSFPPKRIISIAPGLTDTLYTLNLDKEIVGRTRYCIYPKGKVEQSETVGGTKKIHLEKIRALKPDLIFAEKEENTKEIVETLEQEFPVFVAEVQSVQDAYKMITDLGTVTDRKHQAEQLVTTIKDGFKSLPAGQNKKIGYVIWKNPYMVAGNHTYINTVFEMMGFENAFKKFDGRYPEVTEKDFQNANLDYLFLATEPFPFKEEHRRNFSELLPDVNVQILDGEMFWYGPRMIDAVEYFKINL
ncbi:ABC transporter substrate-binding protein [Bacillaceae bacterium W0354]